MEHKHALGIIPLTGSRTLQCMGHYGMRSILLVYMMHGPLEVQTAQAGTIYGWFIMGAGLLSIFGGMLGDLLMGPRTAAIAGGFMQATGCFLLCIPHVAALYAGLGLIALGLALYNPNITATLALLYRGREKMLDSALMIFYTGLTLGVCISSALIVFLNEQIGSWAGFLASGIFLCASLLLLLLPQKSLADAPYKASVYLEESHRELSSPSRPLLPGFISIFIFVPMFWMMYNLCNDLMINNMIQMNTAGAIKDLNIIQKIYMIDPIITIIGGVALAAIWAFVQVSAFLKMAMGFLVYLLAFALFYTAYAEGRAVLGCVAGGYILQTVAELFISPTASALICRYAPVRWTSTLMGAFLLITSAFSYLSSFLLSSAHSLSTGILLGVAGAMVLLLGVLYLVLHFVSGKQQTVTVSPPSYSNLR